LILSACKPKPRAIEFGADECDFCRMTIVDHRFAAEAVTDKGKAFKFDAVECMIDFLNREKEIQFPLQLVFDYENPGDFLHADDCAFLISRSIPSPMGAFISVHSNEEAAKLKVTQNSDQLFTWKELQEYRNSNSESTYE
jgi:copper chaperone NosL